MRDIPAGFVVRQCGCTWYHYGGNKGYLVESCEERGKVFITEKPQAIPTDQPYKIAHPLAIAKIFEMLHTTCKMAEVGRKFIRLHRYMDRAFPEES